MDSVKNRGANKFSSCFHPTVDEDWPSSRAAPTPTPRDVGESRRGKRTAAGRSISGFVKAVFFKTPLWRKLGRKRSNRGSHRSSRSFSIRLQTPTHKNFSNRDHDETYCTNDSSPSLFSSSISSNSSLVSKCVVMTRPKPDSLDSSTNIRQHAMKLVNMSRSYDCKGLMFIILVCLMGLVLLGKAFAIVTCTWAWLLLGSPIARGLWKGPSG